MFAMNNLTYFVVITLLHFYCFSTLHQHLLLSESKQSLYNLKSSKVRVYPLLSFFSSGIHSSSITSSHLWIVLTRWFFIAAVAAAYSAIWVYSTVFLSAHWSCLCRLVACCGVQGWQATPPSSFSFTDWIIHSATAYVISIQNPPFIQNSICWCMKPSIHTQTKALKKTKQDAWTFIQPRQDHICESKHAKDAVEIPGNETDNCQDSEPVIFPDGEASSGVGVYLHVCVGWTECFILQCF